ncbi:hypothetical protein EG327_011556 [Venturia inaequalis]|uniref:Uncharacterized protein n=1 Tax=Venturia inaequalis TaxID=5025 RepID=A0A8H3UBW0_VENIN|nr:hypothetical protein EG327_011556 [Venturia inaequalis]
MKGRETQAAKDSTIQRIRTLPTPETPGAANWDKKQINALLDHRLSPIVDAENVKNALHPVDAAATNRRDFLRELLLYLQLLHAKHFSWEITFRLLSVTIYNRIIERNKGTRVSCKLTMGDVKKTSAMFKKVNEEYANIGGAKYTPDFVKLAFSPMITDKQWGELILLL